MSRRERVDQVKLTGPGITLGDLRWLIQQCDGMPDSGTVTVRGGRDDQRDPVPEEIVVSGGRTPTRPPPAVHYPPGVRGA